MKQKHYARKNYCYNNIRTLYHYIINQVFKIIIPLNYKK